MITQTKRHRRVRHRHARVHDQQAPPSPPTRSAADSNSSFADMWHCSQQDRLTTMLCRVWSSYKFKKVSQL